MISCQLELSFNVTLIYREILEDRELNKQKNTIFKRIKRAYKIIYTIIIIKYRMEMKKIFPIMMENFDTKSTYIYFQKLNSIS
jgi:hypothetical protein